MERTDSEILLQQLLDACRQGRQGAIRLARQARAEPLRSLLEESAQQYECAADEIRTMWNPEPRTGAPPGPHGGRSEAVAGEDIAASWERAECEALTYFRDAYDGGLPEPLREAVRRHYEAGITRLERLRSMQARRRRA
jgi:hypothetical protein